MDKRASIAGLLEAIDRMSPAGFAIALHIRYSSSDFLFQTYPPKWVEIYNERGYLMHDPVVTWCFENTGAIRWRDLEERDEKGVMREARRYGMLYGVSIALVEGGSRSIAGCARSDRDYLDVEITELQALVRELHGETAGLGRLSEQDTAALQAMSIRLTHR